MGYGSEARGEPIAYVNGEFVSLSEAKISVQDRGFLYGDGLFETMRTYRGRPFLADAHLERLFEGAERIKLKIHLSRKELKKIIFATLKANSFAESMIRLTITRGSGEAGRLKFPTDAETTVVIIKGLTPYPRKFYQRGIPAITLPDRRGILASLKSLNFLANVLAKQVAEEKGAFEAILVNDDGYVTEGTVSNVFIVIGGVLFTPPVELGLLPGVTREVVIKLAKKIGITCRKEKFGQAELLAAEEVFLTNTSIELMPVTSIDGISIGDGKKRNITKILHQKYGEFVSQQI